MQEFNCPYKLCDYLFKSCSYYNLLLYLSYKIEVSMADLFDYLKWRGDITFNQVSFNIVDALMLSNLSYSIFDNLVSGDFKEQKTFEQLAEDFKASPDYEERLNIGFLINKKTVDLMFACAASERFKNVKICGYRSVYSEENVEQFAAMTYLVDDKVIVSYRGTDDTLVGWKEDFNIVWQHPIPAQKDAIEYLNDCAAKMDGKLVLIGHSKGGNLVVNTGACCSKNIQDRIEALYNFDGPGFSEEFFLSDEYKAIESRLISVYPEFSIVGMIFRHPADYIVTKSDGFAVMQHDGMTWQIMGSGMDKAEDFKDESKFFYKAFNNWVDNLSPEQTQHFVTALWDVIEASEVKTNTELQENALACVAKMVVKMSSLDKKTKQEVREILGLLKTAVRNDSPFARLLAISKQETK